MALPCSPLPMPMELALDQETFLAYKMLTISSSKANCTSNQWYLKLTPMYYIITQNSIWKNAINQTFIFKTSKFLKGKVYYYFFFTNEAKNIHSQEFFRRNSVLRAFRCKHNILGSSTSKIGGKKEHLSEFKLS